MDNHGFIKLHRTNDVLEIIKIRPSAFLLLTIIAWRARRTSIRFDDTNLELNQARIGDWKNYTSSEQVYKDDKTFLERHKIATFKGTSKGTIATLIDSTIYDINSGSVNEPVNEQITSRERAESELRATKKNDKKEKNEKEDKGKILSTAEALKLKTIESMKKIVLRSSLWKLKITREIYFNMVESAYEWSNSNSKKKQDWELTIRTWLRKEKYPEMDEEMALIHYIETYNMDIEAVKEYRK